MVRNHHHISIGVWIVVLLYRGMFSVVTTCVSEHFTYVFRMLLDNPFDAMQQLNVVIFLDTCISTVVL